MQMTPPVQIKITPTQGLFLGDILRIMFSSF